MTLTMMVGMSVTAFASSGKTVKLKSYEGYNNNTISISNVVEIQNTEYIWDQDVPTYLCKSPATVTALDNINIMLVQKVNNENLEKMKRGQEFFMDEVPLQGKVTVSDWETGKERIIDHKDMSQDEEWDMPLIHKGTKATLTQKGAYVIYSATAPSSDFITAIVLVDGGNAASPTPVTQVTSTEANVLVDGKKTAFDAYNIANSNYFKLRDLAYVLNGTDKQFEVSWDQENRAILLTTGTAYTPDGSEMKSAATKAKTATSTSSKIFIDGEAVNLTAYNIGGNNYFKLRDIGQACDFQVGWDDASNSISINSALDGN